MIFQGNKLTIEQSNSMKGIAILAVVLIHMMPSETEGVFYGLQVFFSQASLFAVPLFLILSGIGLEKSGKYKMKYIDFVTGRLIKILPLYLVWTTVYHLFYNKPYTFASVIKSFFGESSGQMYYVVVLLFMYVCYPLLRRMALAKSSLVMLLAFSFLVQILAVLFPELLGNRLNVFSWIGYFCVGIYLANHEIRAKRVVIITLILIGLIGMIYLALMGVGSARRPVVMVYTVGLLFYLVNIKSKVLQLFGRHSFNIFLSHILVIALVQGALDWIVRDVSILVSYPTVLGCSLLFSFLFIKASASVVGNLDILNK